MYSKMIKRSRLARIAKLEEKLEEGFINGVVKDFDNEKGFGTVIDNYGQKYFIHHTYLTRMEYKILSPTQKIQFMPTLGERGLQALDIASY